jgi:Helix-turn-helix domain
VTPTPIVEGVLWTPADCSRFAVPLRRLAEQRARLDGTTIDRRLLDLLDAMESVGRAHRAREATEATPSNPEALETRRAVAPSAALWNVSQTAEHLGCSRQNVTARCRRGTIPAVKRLGRWLVDPDALAA